MRNIVLLRSQEPGARSQEPGARIGFSFIMEKWYCEKRIEDSGEDGDA